MRQTMPVQKMLRALALMVAIAGLLMPAPAADALVLVPTDPGRQCGWPIAYPGDANYAFPDTSAAYFVQAAVLEPGDRLVFSGSDPKARYWSMQTYRYSDSSLLDAVNDVTVLRTGRGSTWTITVVPPAQDSGRDPNVLSAAGAYDGTHYGSNVTVVMFRVYVSSTGSASGGPLPRVSLVRAAGGTTPLKACRADQVGPPESRPVLSPVEGASSRFARGDADRFYASADASYLGAQAPYDDSAILVVSGKAPRVRKDVRYWSVCQNVNAGDLPVVDCVRDDEVHLDAQGRFHIAVVGPGQIPDPASYPGVDFIAWGAPVAGRMADAFLLYRHLLPRKGFAGSVTRVPYGAFADDYMGAYAPTLTSMPRAQFDAQFRLPAQFRSHP